MPFDVLWLRSQPDFRPYLTPDTPIVDLSVMNYLHSEIRPERSLKNIVSLFNIDRYDSEESLKHGNRYAHPGDPRLLSYNARDSHNTAAAISYLARRTQADHPRSDKGSDWCIRHYSDSVYLCTQLAEHGIPFSRRLLESLENSCLQRATDASRLALTQHNLPLDGPGSQKPQLEFMEMIAREIDRLRPSQPSILSDKRVRFSDKRKQLGVTDLNREIFEMALPADHPLQAPLAAWDTAKSAQKLVSTYTYPLLRGARKPKPNKFNQPSILINDRAYPSWYPVPSQIKDGQGAEGGTEQGRMTAKNPAVQTLPSEVKDCIRPSSPDGVILWADLSQIELRVAALLSGEPSLLHAYATNSDLHTETAIDIFGRDELLRKYRLPSSLSPPETVSALKKVKEFNDLERQCGKHGNFTALNRGGAETLQRTILKKGHVAVPLSFCEAEVRTRQRRRPLLWDWQEQQLVTAKRDKILTLPICGVSRFFSGSDMVIEETFRSHVVNFPIQTWAGLLMRELQIRIMRRLHHYNIYRPRIRQIINIYDATALECRYRSDLPYALSVLSFCFNELSTPGGLWYLLQRHYGHTCPIAYDTKEITHGGPDC